MGLFLFVRFKVVCIGFLFVELYRFSGVVVGDGECCEGVGEGYVEGILF